MVDSNTVEAARLLSFALLAANILSAGVASKVANDKSRDWKLWIMRSMLGGIQSLMVVWGLGKKPAVAAE